MGLKVRLKIIGKAVARYTNAARNTDDAVSVFVKKTDDLIELGDTIKLSKTKFQIPSKEKLEFIKQEQGLHENIIRNADGMPAWHGRTETPYINENNSLFLEYLLEKFPKYKYSDEVTNIKLQEIMLYLQDIDHTKFLNKQAFLDDFLKEVEKISSIKGVDGSILYGKNAHSLYSKKAILDAMYNNPERYDDIMNLIALHQKGIVPKHMISLFFPKGQINSLVKSDMHKLLKGEHYYPQLTEFAEDVITKFEIGEAFSVGKDMFVKTSNGYKKLKMDSKTYEKLFPPMERFAISQGNAGNCGKIAAWNAMIKNPKSRIMLYDLFEQTPEGVIVNMCDGRFIKNFKFNDLSILDNPECLQGSLGYQMLEHTYDFGLTGHIQTTNGLYDRMIEQLTGKTFVDGHTVEALEKALKTNEGLFFFNGGKKDLNIGLWDDHWFSSTNRKSGIWQNPWSGVEEIKLDEDVKGYANFIWK